MRKTLLIIGIALAILLVGTFITFPILKKTNKNVKEWSSYPDEIKYLNAKLFLEKPFFWMFPPRLDVRETPVTVDKIKRSVSSGANWIVQMQEESGRYNYWYDPGADKFSSKYDDNFLRQAGTGYSLMLVYEITGEQEYLNSALRNLDFLSQFEMPLGTSKLYYLYNQKAKLGGLALPMLTMLKYRQITKDTLFDTTLKKLAEMILYLQSKYDSGKFKSTYIYRGDYNYEENSGWESQIYPGEALLALVFMYDQFQDTKYLTAIDQAFDYYSEKGRWRHFSFIPWTTSAYAELYAIVPKEKYAKFVYKMSDYMLIFQNLNQKRMAFGSLFSAPSVFTSTWFEGIGDAIHVARLRNDAAMETKYSSRSLMAYQWLMELQYTENDSVPLPAVGGFKKSLHQSKIRIDNTQHAISAMCRGLKYIYKVELKGYKSDQKQES